MRTTVDIDPSVLRALKQRQLSENKTLGQLMSELLAEALERAPAVPQADFHWVTADLGPRVDLEDKDAVWRILDGAS